MQCSYRSMTNTVLVFITEVPCFSQQYNKFMQHSDVFNYLMLWFSFSNPSFPGFLCRPIKILFLLQTGGDLKSVTEQIIMKILLNKIIWLRTGGHYVAMCQSRLKNQIWYQINNIKQTIRTIYYVYPVIILKLHICHIVLSKISDIH